MSGRGLFQAGSPHGDLGLTDLESASSEFGFPGRGASPSPTGPFPARGAQLGLRLPGQRLEVERVGCPRTCRGRAPQRQRDLTAAPARPTAWEGWSRCGRTGWTPPWLVSCPPGPQPDRGEHLILVPAGQALRAPAAPGTPLPSGHWPGPGLSRAKAWLPLEPPRWWDPVERGRLGLSTGPGRPLRCPASHGPPAVRAVSRRKGPISRLLPPSPLSLALLPASGQRAGPPGWRHCPTCPG